MCDKCPSGRGKKSVKNSVAYFMDGPLNLSLSTKTLDLSIGRQSTPAHYVGLWMLQIWVLCCAYKVSRTLEVIHSYPSPPNDSRQQLMMMILVRELDTRDLV